MLKRYLKRRDNPWELLAIASAYLLPGAAVLVHHGPVPFYNIRHTTMRPTIMSEGAAHIFGGSAVLVGVVLIVLYFYVRSTSRMEQTIASAGHPTRQHKGAAKELHLVYGSTRSPIALFERLRFWQKRP
jgi:hypothetical protein